MDEIPPEPTEALFMVLASLVRNLSRSGLVNQGTFDTMREAFAMQAEATCIPQKRADCQLAAEYAEVLSIVASADETKHQTGPHLRLVEDAEGGPEQQ